MKNLSDFVLEQLFPVLLPEKDLKLLDKIIYCLSMFLRFCQKLRFLWHSNMGISGWSNLSKVFIFLSYFCQDVFAANFLNLDFFILLSHAIISLTLLFFIFHLISCYYKNQKYSFIQKLLTIFLKVLTQALFIPISVILAITLYQSLKNDNIVKFYNFDINSQFINVGKDWIILIVIEILIHLMFIIIYDGFGLEISAHLACKNLNAKSEGYFELYFRIVEYFISFAYPFIAFDHYYVYLIIQLAFYISISAFYIKNLPYYNSMANICHLILNFDLACITLFFMIGMLQSNLGVTLILSIFLQPIIIIFINNLNDKRSDTLKTSISSSYHYFMVKNYSNFINSSSSAEELFKLAHDNFRITHNQLIYLHMSQYCSFILENHSLASIKTTYIEKIQSNSIRKFQLFRWGKYLNKEIRVSSFGFKILKFIDKKEKALFNDKYFCLNLLELLDRILDNNETKASIESFIIKTDEFLNKSFKYHRRLAFENPDSTIASFLYGSFLIEVLGKIDEGQAEITKAQNEPLKKSKGSSKCLNIISDTSSNHLVFSGNIDTMGLILYICPNTCSLLEISEEEIINKSIREIIPNIQFYDIEKTLQKFIQIGTNNHIKLPCPIFLLNNKGFLIECFVSIECVAIHKDLKFLCIIEPLNKNTRQAAILNESGTIINHTQHFNLMMGISYFKIDSGSIFTFIGEELYSKLLSEEVAEYSNLMHKSLALLMKKYVLGKGQIIVLYCFSDFNEIRRLTSTGIKNSSRRVKEENKFEIKLANDTSNVINEPYLRKVEDSEGRTGIEIKEGVSTSGKNERISYMIKRRVQEANILYKVLKWIYYFSVFSKKVFCLISCSCGLLVVSDENISTISKLESIRIFGDLSYEISKLALFIKSAENSQYYGAQRYFSIDQINSAISIIEKTSSDLRSSKIDKKFCKISRILNQARLKVLSTNSTFKKDNIMNTLIKTQSSVISK